MLVLTDLKADNSDDIILKYGDIQIETETLQNSINVAGRRICGRFDDNDFRQDLCAGLERFLFSPNITNSTYDITSSIIKCLSRDNLFFSSDYDIKIGSTNNPKEAKLYIVFKTSMFGSVSMFKIFVDIENQRVYRG